MNLRISFASQQKPISVTVEEEVPAIAKPESSQQNPAIDLGPYMHDLQLRIRSFWHPKNALSHQNPVQISFSVDQSGNVHGVKLEKSSGSEAWDQAAMKAITDASPFKPLPPEQKCPIDILFTFDPAWLLVTTGPVS